jgi:hypothetical protein
MRGLRPKYEINVRQWCRMFKDGRANVRYEERSGRPSVVSGDLIQSVDQKICDRRRLAISELSCESPQISRTVLDEIKFCARWVPKMPRALIKSKEWLRLWLFLERYPNIAMNFSVTSTSNMWWNQAFICECWNDRAVKAVDAHTFTKQAEKV